MVTRPTLTQGIKAKHGRAGSGAAPVTAVRDHNATVDFVDRNVVEGRGDKTIFIDPVRNFSYRELRDTVARIGLGGCVEGAVRPRHRR
jgi:hypothetical protein